MNNKKMRLTESELHQVVEASVRQILMKEGFFKKAGDAIDRFENWANDKMDDFERGYDIKEGNPTSVFDVIEGNGWEPVENKKKPISDGQNYMGVKKVTGTWGIHNGLSIDELIEDINIFLDGRGHASHVQTVNGYSEVIAVDAPANLIKGNGLNESFEMGGDMVKFYLNSPMNGRQVITVPFEEFANAQYKNDYLWEKAAEQGNIKLMRNGYFEVDPNDPHKAEVDRIF